MACALTWTVRQFRAVSAGHQRSVATDDKTKAHGQDLERINVNQDFELRDWSKELGVTPEELKAVVKKVGDWASVVEAHIKSR